MFANFYCIIRVFGGEAVPLDSYNLAKRRTNLAADFSYIGYALKFVCGFIPNGSKFTCSFHKTFVSFENGCIESYMQIKIDKKQNFQIKINLLQFQEQLDICNSGPRRYSPLHQVPLYHK